ncbi:Sec-independent protein translocase TatC [Methylophaga lonarensis MPL]|uniref:Sec-independent protein translocase protein TatC n=1 Tax=Methylophaga lonarensis MPL TaxID=1286106 RepID=M7PJE5_9GAMM|nr:Sec-independent protein translocase TatC [Methylophaga lonarensis MPL]
MSSENSFLSHLLELRDRLLRSIVGMLALTILLLPFANDIYRLLAEPLLLSLPVGGQMIATEVTTPFFIPMKAVLLVAFLLSSPYTIYQLWAFVAPGLHDSERRLLIPLVLSSVLLLFCGIAFAYFLVFPVVFGFISSTTPEGVAMMTDIGRYLDFALTLFIAFGLAFETPVVVVLLVRLGVVSVNALREARAYVIVGAFVLGAIVTPPDIMSQFLLAIPMWILYEIGIMVAGLIEQRNQAFSKTPQSENHR